MTNLRKQREKRLKELIVWTRAERARILENLRAKRYYRDQETYEYSEYYESMKTYRSEKPIEFDAMPDRIRENKLGQLLYWSVRRRLAKKYLLAGKTARNYLEIVLTSLDCELHKRLWRCPS